MRGSVTFDGKTITLTLAPPTATGTSFVDPPQVVPQGGAVSVASAAFVGGNLVVELTPRLGGGPIEVAVVVMCNAGSQGVAVDVDLSSDTVTFHDQ